MGIENSRMYTNLSEKMQPKKVVVKKQFSEKKFEVPKNLFIGQNFFWGAFCQWGKRTFLKSA
jgi:hypothetical protein